MNHILLVTLGSSGDINPFLFLGKSFLKRGIHPIALINPYDQTKFEKNQLDCELLPHSVNVKEAIKENPKYMSLRGGEAVLREMYLPATPYIFEKTEELIKKYKPKFIISHPLCVGSLFAAKKYKIPSLVVHLAPFSLFERDLFAIYPLWERFILKTLLQIGLVYGSLLLRKHCKRYHHPFSINVFKKLLTENDHTIALFSKAFYKASTTKNILQASFPLHKEEKQELPSTVKSFLEDKDPPLIFAFGSTAIHVADSIFKLIPKICKDLNKRAIVLGDYSYQEPLTDQILQVPYVDYSLLFPHGEAIIHHGGIGTTSFALASGKPSLVIPFAHDQFDNARRIEALGLGKELKALFASEQRLKKKISTITQDHYKVKALEKKEQFNQEKEIEKLLTFLIQKYITPKTP